MQQKPLSKTVKWLDKRDLFATRVRSFNFEGRNQVYSPFGCFWTVIIWYLLTHFVCILLMKVYLKSNPIITSNENFGVHMSNETGVEINQDGRFMLAFQMQNYIEGNIFNDTDLAHWEVHVYNGNGVDNDLDHVIGVHKCHKEEWD